MDILLVVVTRGGQLCVCTASLFSLNFRWTESFSQTARFRRSQCAPSTQHPTKLNFLFRSPQKINFSNEMWQRLFVVCYGDRSATATAPKWANVLSIGVFAKCANTHIRSTPQFDNRFDSHSLLGLPFKIDCKKYTTQTVITREFLVICGKMQSTKKNKTTKRSNWLGMPFEMQWHYSLSRSITLVKQNVRGRARESICDFYYITLKTHEKKH